MDVSVSLCTIAGYINAVAIRNSHPILSSRDEFIDSLGEGQVYLTVNKNSRYWQVSFEEKILPRLRSSLITGYSSFLECHSGSRTPQQCSSEWWTLYWTMSSANAPFFTRMICSSFAKTPELHLKSIENLLFKLREPGLRWKLGKGIFFSHISSCLGNVMDTGEQQVLQIATEAIESLQYPTFISKLRSFPGRTTITTVLFQISHGSIPRWTEIWLKEIHALSRSTQTSVTTRWGADCNMSRTTRSWSQLTSGLIRCTVRRQDMKQNHLQMFFFGKMGRAATASFPEENLTLLSQQNIRSSSGYWIWKKQLKCRFDRDPDLKSPVPRSSITSNYIIKRQMRYL